jgi:SAM-dependent methyltransferase
MNLDSNISHASVPAPNFAHSEYVLATGTRAVRRLLMLHDIYGTVGQRLLLKAGLKPGMKIADFGCGIGAVTRMLADMTGPSGTVTGIDASEGQLVEAGFLCEQAGLTNALWWKADACATRLPSDTFDLVYCRFLLIHLPDPDGSGQQGRRGLRTGVPVAGRFDRGIQGEWHRSREIQRRRKLAAVDACAHCHPARWNCRVGRGGS